MIMTAATRTYTRSDADVQDALFMGAVFVGTVSDPEGEIVLAVDGEGTARAAADLALHQEAVAAYPGGEAALLANLREGVEDEGAAFVRLPAGPMPEMDYGFGLDWDDDEDF